MGGARARVDDVQSRQRRARVEQLCVGVEQRQQQGQGLRTSTSTVVLYYGTSTYDYTFTYIYIHLSAANRGASIMLRGSHYAPGYASIVGVGQPCCCR